MHRRMNGILALLRLCGFVIAGLVALPLAANAQDWLSPDSEMVTSAPDTAMIARLFPGVDEPRIERQDGKAPAWKVTHPDGSLVGYVASTWEIAGSVGYSGRPLDVLVAVDADSVISGAVLIRHNEPILTLGLSDADIARFVDGFAGVDLRDPHGSIERTGAAPPDIISRATVSTAVIRDSILRTARTVALVYGLMPGQGVERVGFVPQTVDELLASGAITRLTVTMNEAAAAFAAAKIPLTASDDPFLDLWVALVDPPTIGRNLLGEQLYTKIIGSLGVGEVALFFGSRGLHSHRGTNWRQSGVFDRIALIQDGRRFPLVKKAYTRIDKLALAGMPELKERSIFSVDTALFDPTAPFRVEVNARRTPAKGGDDLYLTIGLDYTLPGAFVHPPPPDPLPLWQEAWERKSLSVIGVSIMLAILTGFMFFQEFLVRNPKVWLAVRLGFLSVTLVWLGWGINGQLSVVQVVAFIQSLLTGFHWETFLIEPVIFILWGGVALGLLFLGRGVYCGWLCPFGALQELTNFVARRFNVPQIAVPHALHERLWVIKYTLFVVILGLSFYSMKDALILAEVEPFKTAISMRMMRSWPFVAFVLALLVAGLFIERFYCRYLCPLGAALAIPAKLKVFDWLRRRPQCGRECRLCEQKCTVGAIDTLGRINPNECVLCLRCQVIFYDAGTCPVLKRRARQSAS